MICADQKEDSMTEIHVLSEETIDKIAAGEVIERPSSVVKELLENAIDAGAKAVTIEIKDGGISFIRVTDNGCGIDKSQIRNAFYRHATSKLNSAAELDYVGTLGFRGEALSSIAAVAQVEMITKPNEKLTGVRYVIEGAEEKEYQEIGVPWGTTIIVRNLFYNTPVRRKFLKPANVEAAYIVELCERMSLSRPNVSFQLIQNGLLKFNTSGNGDEEELIYRVYGKEIARDVVPIHQKGNGVTLSGVIGRPTLGRSNRNYENFFVNGRYIKSRLIARAAEAGFAPYLMQHKYPFFILKLDVDPHLVDINVHPTKMDVRFANSEYVYDFISSTIDSTLKMQELIPKLTLLEEKERERKELEKKAREKELQALRARTPEPFEVERKQEAAQKIIEEAPAVYQNNKPKTAGIIKADQVVYAKTPEQMSLFETPFLSKEAQTEYEILGQLFDTYWLIAYGDKLLIMDQHAAHEKVKYERLVRHYKEKTVETQLLNPPIILSLSTKEKTILEDYKMYFEGLGFVLEDFGGNEIAIRAVPMDLYGQNEKDMFLSLLDELCDEVPKGKQELIYEKIASMSCKAAVKGNNRLSREEVKELIRELMTLENPYHCPHGRPTIISMTKYELEKKFKRII